MAFYNGKKALVVGGSAGIGREVALEMARRGASVCVAARGQQRLDETLEALRALAQPGQVMSAVCIDVRAGEATRQRVDEAVAALGGLDAVVCCSGFARTGTIADLPEEEFVELLEVNYLGHVRVIRACLPYLTQQRSGHICLVSSMLGFMSTYGYGAYSASKFAIAGVAEALRQEMKMHGVNVSVYYPPTTRTPGLDLENATKPELVWKLEEGNNITRIYDAEAVGRSICDHIPRGRFEGWIGFDSGLVRLAFRYLPGLARKMADWELDRARRAIAEAPGSAGSPKV